MSRAIGIMNAATGASYVMINLLYQVHDRQHEERTRLAALTRKTAYLCLVLKGFSQ
jgi:hypothetical protein